MGGDRTLRQFQVSLFFCGQIEAHRFRHSILHLSAAGAGVGAPQLPASGELGLHEPLVQSRSLCGEMQARQSLGG
jgi:hypothetical protein